MSRNELSFREFVNYANPRYQWYRHCEVLADVAQRVADGELTRVMIFLPPRHGKSELISRLFSAYYLYRHPERWVGINSYGADLAYTLSRAARDNYQRVGGDVRDDAAAVRHWETPAGGGMWAAGVGGPITGKGFHLGIIDDPVKNAEDAASEVIRATQQEWYQSTFYTREEPGGAIVVIQTRWHEADLSGWLLAQEGEDDEPEGWFIICLPAIAEEAPAQFPQTCTVAPDWRAPGEPLCPERYPLAKLQKLAKRIGSYFFGALFQQRPSAAEGNIFRRAWFSRRYKSLDGIQEVWTTWDTALKEKEENDQSAFVSWALLANGDICVLRAGRGHWSTPDLEKFLCDHATRMRATYGVQYRGDYVEDKVSGTTLMQYVRRSHPELALIPIPAESDKEARARGVTPICEADRVVLPDLTAYPEAQGWVDDLLYVLMAFPKGRWKDLVDAFVYGLMHVMDGGNKYASVASAGSARPTW